MDTSYNRVKMLGEVLDKLELGLSRGEGIRSRGDERNLLCEK